MDRDFIRFSEPPVKPQFSVAGAELTSASCHQLLMAEDSGSAAQSRFLELPFAFVPKRLYNEALNSGQCP